jgi:hypothetical protein
VFPSTTDPVRVTEQKRSARDRLDQKLLVIQGAGKAVTAALYAFHAKFGLFIVHEGKNGQLPVSVCTMDSIDQYEKLLGTMVGHSIALSGQLFRQQKCFDGTSQRLQMICHESHRRRYKHGHSIALSGQLFRQQKCFDGTSQRLQMICHEAHRRRYKHVLL